MAKKKKSLQRSSSTTTKKNTDKKIINSSKAKNKSSAASAQNVNNITIKITQPVKQKTKRRKSSVNSGKTSALDELEEVINTFDEIKDIAKQKGIKVPQDIAEVGNISSVKSVKDIKELIEILKDKIQRIAELIQNKSRPQQQIQQIPQPIQRAGINIPSPSQLFGAQPLGAIPSGQLPQRPPIPTQLPQIPEEPDDGYTQQELNNKRDNIFGTI